MATPLYPLLPGTFGIKGTKPDGDTVRFTAQHPDHYKHIDRGYRLEKEKGEGGSTVFVAHQSIRFDVVDAPESHYALRTALGGVQLPGTSSSVLQPQWREARDAMLHQLGFTDWTPDDQPDTVLATSTPLTVPGAIIGKGVDRYDRIVGYVLAGAEAEAARDRGVKIRGVTYVELDDVVLKSTVNYRLIADGLTYYTMYSSTPYALRPLLREAAQRAQREQRGIWKDDKTPLFSVTNAESIGVGGSVILPKLFRRCSDYMHDRDRFGFPGTLPEWMYVTGKSDKVAMWLPNLRVFPTDFASLIDQAGDRVAFTANVLDLIFEDA